MIILRYLLPIVAVIVLVADIATAEMTFEALLGPHMTSSAHGGGTSSTTTATAISPVLIAPIYSLGKCHGGGVGKW